MRKRNEEGRLSRCALPVTKDEEDEEEEGEEEEGEEKDKEEKDRQVGAKGKKGCEKKNSG